MGEAWRPRHGRAISMRWPAWCSAMRRLFAVLESLDNGKPIRETRDHRCAAGGAAFLSSCRLGAAAGAANFADHVPVGVVGQIIPWNFPLLMLAWKVAPALALGNTVVLKPAEFTLADGACCSPSSPRKAGLPPGVLNVVTGEGATGAALVEHAGVDKIAFTGSTEVGRLIRKARPRARASR